MRANKISLINNINYGSKGRIKNKPHCRIRQNANKSVDLQRPAEHRSLSGSCQFNEGVSFTGAPNKFITEVAKEAVEGTLSAPKLMGKLGGSKFFDTVIHSVKKNEAFYDAVMALGVAGILKPICVIAMPGAEMEDKQMSATKNFVSAIIGFALSNLILTPCSDAINTINANPSEYIKDARYVNLLKSEEVLKGLKSTIGDSFTSTYKKGLDTIISPLKAGLTVAFMPVILNLIFGKKKKEKEKQKALEAAKINNSMVVMNTIRMNQNKAEAAK